jgi:hypothetical protein
VARVSKPANPESLRRGVLEALARSRAGLGEPPGAAETVGAADAWREDPPPLRRASA